MPKPMSYPRFKAFDTNGLPLTSGKLYTYTAGTSTPKTTYQDVLLTVPHTNPIILDSNGENEIYLATDEDHKFVLKDSTDSTTFWSIDDYDTTIATAASSPFSDYKLYADPDNIDQGALGNGYSIKDLIATIGSSYGTIVLQHNRDAETTEYNVTTNLELLSYITLEVERGAQITGTGDLTLHGNLDCGNFPVYQGSGNMLFGNASMGDINAAWWGFADYNSQATNKTALEKAIAALSTNGGVVQLPAGTFPLGSGIVLSNDNVTVQGANTAYAVNSTDPATILQCLGTMDYSFKLTGKGCSLRNLKLLSASTYIDYGAQTENCVILEDIQVENFAVAGVRVAKSCEGAVFNRINCYENDQYGVYIDNGSTANKNMTLNQCNCYNNGIFGFYVREGLNIVFNSCSGKSNGQEGVRLYKVSGTTLENITFNDCNFTQNGTLGSTYYNFRILSATGSSYSEVAENVTLNNCEITESTTSGNLLYVLGKNTRFNNCNIKGGSTSTAVYISAYASYTIFDGGYHENPVSSSYGNRGFKIGAKTTGTTGLEINGGVFATRGRTSTFWFWLENATAGNTYDCKTAMASFYMSDSYGYPMLSAGSLIGIVGINKYSISAGQINLRPYRRTSWTGGSTEYTGYDLILNSSDNNVQRTYAKEHFTFSAGYLIGVKAVVSSSFASTQGRMMIGLTYEF